MTEVMKASTRYKQLKFKVLSCLLTILLFLFVFLGSTSSQEVKCPGEGVSYVSHLDCTRYIICVNGQSFLMACPRPLYYNAEERHCDFPEHVPKCIRGTRPPIAGVVIPKPPGSSGESGESTESDELPTDPPFTDESQNEIETSTGSGADSSTTSSGAEGGEGDPSKPNGTEKPSSSSSTSTEKPSASTSSTTAMTSTTSSTTEIAVTTTISTTKKPKPTKTTTTYPPMTFPAPGDSVPITECGDTIHANSGTIEYKLNENYDEGEMCAFIIRTDNFPHIAFRLDSHGIHDSDTNAITIVNFPNSNDKVAEYYHFGPPNSIRTRFINGSAAVVIFKSGSNLGTGFRLSYHASGTPGYPYPGMDFVYNNLTASPVSIPFWDNFTSGYPQKNLIVLTAESKIITDPGTYLKLVVWESFVCGDFEYFTIFPFDGKSVSRETVYTDDEYADEYRDRRTVFKTKGLFIVEYTQFNAKTGRKRLTWEKIIS
ncbi:unnamed protein product [Orchesella dallaii]|uniref:Chitin-binding type-2 domain-containing protein n=1 Tax=Orchesella dallaii TaxID=48710 RepID=A0ABP1RLU6_9HEXA